MCTVSRLGVLAARQYLKTAMAKALPGATNLSSDGSVLWPDSYVAKGLGRMFATPVRNALAGAEAMSRPFVREGKNMSGPVPAEGWQAPPMRQPLPPPMPQPLAVPKPLPAAPQKMTALGGVGASPQQVPNYAYNYSQYKNQDPASRVRLAGQLKDIRTKSEATEPVWTDYPEVSARLKLMGRGLTPDRPGWDAYQDESNAARAGLGAAVEGHYARSARAQRALVREYEPRYIPEQ